MEFEYQKDKLKPIGSKSLKEFLFNQVKSENALNQKNQVESSQQASWVESKKGPSQDKQTQVKNLGFHCSMTSFVKNPSKVF